jgi:cell division protein FtsL
MGRAATAASPRAKRSPAKGAAAPRERAAPAKHAAPPRHAARRQPAARAGGSRRLSGRAAPARGGVAGRLSGTSTPARGRAAGAALPARLLNAPITRVARARTSTILDRLLAGRGWIALIGLLLVGIVFFNVDLLQMNREIARNAEKGAALQRENARLRRDVARLASSERIQEAAAELGLVLPAPGDVRYLKARPILDARRAAKRITEPTPTFVAPEPVTTAPEPAAPPPTGTTVTPTIPPPTTTTMPQSTAPQPTAPAATGQGIAPTTAQPAG